MEAEFSVCNVCVVYPEVLDAQRGGRYLQTQKLNTLKFPQQSLPKQLHFALATGALMRISVLSGICH